MNIFFETSQMLQTPMGSVFPVIRTTPIPIGGIGEETLRLGISNMKLCYEPPPLGGSGLRRMIGIINFHLILTMDTPPNR